MAYHSGYSYDKLVFLVKKKSHFMSVVDLTTKRECVGRPDVSQT